MFQTVGLLTTAIFQFMILASLMTRTPMVELLGDGSCWMFLTSLTIVWINRILSGVTLAVFRVLSTMCFVLTHKVLGRFFVMWVLVGIEFTCGFYGLQFWLKSSETSGAMALEFCHDRPPIMADIFHSYTLTTQNMDEAAMVEGVWSKKIFLLSIFFLSATELSLYVTLFRSVYQHDKSMVKMLGLDTVR